MEPSSSKVSVAESEIIAFTDSDHIPVLKKNQLLSHDWLKDKE